MSERCEIEIALAPAYRYSDLLDHPDIPVVPREEDLHVWLGGVQEPIHPRTAQLTEVLAPLLSLLIHEW